jgi:hypothetical protein
MSNKRINVAELDFEGIRNNLKEFLRGQDRFKDFDYEGSNMAILLDLLAYNTHYNALYSNMAVNELFIDSASKRSSVVSLARSLGYTPKSRTSSQTTLSFTVSNVPGDPDFLVLPRYTKFHATKDGVKYSFNTMEEYSVAADSLRRFQFSNVMIKEGTVGSLRFVVDDATRFVIPSTTVDTTTLRVKVNESETYKDYTFYVNANRESKIDGTREVYFIKETFDGFTEIIFGDGVFGKSLSNGNVVNIEYLISKGSDANGIKRGFALSEQNTVPGSLSNLILLTQDKGGTFGGAEKESVEEVRFNAPNLYASQGRAVTELDYEALITEKVPTIDQCIVWGGEKNIPPVYGKVFISAKTQNEQPLTFAEKESITENIINPLKVVSVVTEFVDPDYIRAILDIRVYFDPKNTVSREADIATFARQVAIQYSENELERYNRIFRKSQLSRLIELTDDGILSTVIRSRLGFDIVPNFASTTNYEFIINNPVVPGSLQSEPFYISNVATLGGQLIPLYFDDDSQGIVRIYWLNNGAKTILNPNIGSFDYNKGILKLNNLRVYNATAENLRFTVTPSSDDIAGFNNKIVLLDKQRLKVSAVRDETNDRDASGFVFSPNRI